MRLPSFDLPRSFARALAALTLTLGMLLPLAASATDPIAAPAPRLESRWYGWQTLVNDGASTALLTAGVLSSDTAGVALAATGLATYALGAPIIHFVHRNPGRAFGSFALRVPMPIVLGAGTAAWVCHDSHGDFCGLVAIPAGLLGVVAAIAIDAAALAWDHVPSDTARCAEPSTLFAHLGVAPMFSSSRRETTVGLSLSL